MAPVDALRQAQLALYRHPELVPQWVGSRKAPIDSSVTKPVNPARSEVTLRPRQATRTTPPKWWAAFVLSGAGR